MSMKSKNIAVVEPRLWVGIGAAILGVFMAVLDTQITNASLPEILGSISASAEEGSWMSTTYLAAEVIAIPLTGPFIKIFGPRSFVLWNTILFLIFSTLCGVSWNLESMIIFRTLQGFFGGALIPTAMTLIVITLPLSKKPLALAWLMLASTLAPTLGPTVGGIITEFYSWPWIFYINWIPGILMLAGVAIGLDDQKKNIKLLLDMDWLGILGMVVGLGALIVFLEEGNRKDWLESDFIQLVGLISFLGIFVWISSQLLNSNPFINIRLLCNRNFLISSSVGAIAGLALYGSTFVLPMFLANISGYNSLQIGETIMWMGLPQIFVTPIAAVLAKKIDNRLICSIGLLFFSASCFMNAYLTADTGYDQLIFSQVLRAVGQPLILIALSNMAIHKIEAQNLSSASSLYNMTRVLGGAIGTAILSTVISRRESMHSEHLSNLVSVFSEETMDRLTHISKMYLGVNGDADLSAQQALATLDMLATREAFVMAYSDSFFILGSMLLLAFICIWIADKITTNGSK